MDDSVRQAMAKWPDVPALYGWVGLDERGHWRLRGEPIMHAGLIEFINRNYAQDEHGAWFFQNGPQRGYVHLSYTPWVVHVDATGTLHTQTGAAIGSVMAAYLDDQGNLLIETDFGPALVDTDAMAAVADWIRDPDDRPVEPEALEAAAAGGQQSLVLVYRGCRAPVRTIERERVPSYFGFVRDPQPAS